MIFDLPPPIVSRVADPCSNVIRSLVRRFPAAVASRAFEQIVLSAPGFSQDENGRYHFQGGHSQQLLVIDGHPIGAPEDLLDLLTGDRVGKAATLQVLRGGTPIEVAVTVGERPAS